MWWTTHLEGGPRRVNHASVAIGDFIYSFGGYCSGPDYDAKKDMDVFVLNTRNYRWRNLFEKKRRSTNSLSRKSDLIRRNIYVFDEPKEEEEEPTVFDENEHIYSVIMRESKPVVKKDSPSQRYGHTVVAFNGLIYLWGGRNDQYGSASTLHEFDPATSTWKTVPASSSTVVPPARDGHSAVIWDNSMYIFGGFEYMASAFSNDVFEYKFGANAWSRMQTTGQAPSPRDFHSACVLDGVMYVFGGRGDDLESSEAESDTYCDSLYALDLRTKQWSCVEAGGDLPSGRRSHSTWIYRGKMYLFGGYESMSNKHFNDLYSFDPATKQWTRVFPDGVLPCPRRRHCSCIVNDRVFIFGGTAPSKNKGNKSSCLSDLADTHVLDYSATLKTLMLRKIISTRPSYRKLPYMGLVMRDLLNAAVPNSISPNSSKKV